MKILRSFPQLFKTFRFSPVNLAGLDKRCCISTLCPVAVRIGSSQKLNVRLYSDKVERPDVMDKTRTSRDAAGKKGGPISWFNLGATGVILGVLLAFYYYARNMKEEALEKERKKAAGKAKISGQFSLIDHTGKPVKSEDFYGQWLLVYFGFTHCPDICPEEMEKIAEVTDKLAAQASEYGKVQPIFITVDPKRDGTKEVAAYIKEFHPKLIGLTGTEEMVKDTCKSFRVYYSAGPEDDDEDYIVDHTIIVYLIDPSGGFVDYFGQTKTADVITNSVMIHMAKWNNENREKGGLLARVTG